MFINKRYDDFTVKYATLQIQFANIKYILRDSKTKCFATFV